MLSGVVFFVMRSLHVGRDDRMGREVVEMTRWGEWLFEMTGGLNRDGWEEFFEKSGGLFGWYHYFSYLCSGFLLIRNKDV